MSSQHDVDVGDGLSLHVELDGEGPAVVLLHGFTGSGVTWAHLRGHLRARLTVVSVDLPGHGRSSVPDDPARYALARFADDLHRMLGVLGLKQVAMLGYSLGGRAALQFALRHGSRLSALVLESTSPGIADPADRATRAKADAELADFIEREGTEAFVDRWERLPLWSSQSSLPAEVRATLRAQRLEGSPAGLANSLRGAGAGATDAIADRLQDIEVPTLLIAGALDERYAVAAAAMAEAMPHARAAVVADAGHAVHLERPDEFANLVEEFLRNRVR